MRIAFIAAKEKGHPWIMIQLVVETSSIEHILSIRSIIIYRVASKHLDLLIPLNIIIFVCTTCGIFDAAKFTLSN